MINIDEIIKVRKYFFSLPVLTLYQKLLNREMPLIPNVEDRISTLYECLDHIEQENLSPAHSDHLILRFIANAKVATEFRDKRKNYVLTKCSRKILTSKYRIFLYPNDNAIVRITEPFQIAGINLQWRYNFYEHGGDFLREMNDSGIVIIENYVLLKFADYIFYDNWLLKKFIDAGNKNATYVKII